VQGQLAAIEAEFRMPGQIKNPTEVKRFIDCKTGSSKLNVDFVIPDQFIPIYWASMWLMLINSIASFFLVRSYNTGSDQLVMFSWLYVAGTFPLIWKLWTYHVYKIDKFMREHCEFVLVDSGLDCRDEISLYRHRYFRVSALPSLVALIVAMAICVLMRGLSGVHWFMLVGLIAYFFRVPLGILVHILRTLLGLDIPQGCLPELKKLEGCPQCGKDLYRVQQGAFWRMATLGYMIT
jgi:hypothetical protein